MLEQLHTYDLSGGLEACGCKFAGLGALDACNCGGCGGGPLMGLDSITPVFPWGEGFATTALTALHGYRRGGVFGALLWAFAGYMAPLPVAGVAAYQELQGARLFEEHTGMTLPQALRRAGKAGYKRIPRVRMR